MTSAPVKNPVDIMYVARTDSTPSPKGDSNFAGNLKSAVEKSGQNAPKTPTAAEKSQISKKTEDVKADKKGFDRSDMKRPDTPEDVRKESDGAGKRLTDDQAEAVNEKADSLMKRIEEVTGVDEEQLLHAMENLGITGASLFVPENMTNLLMELTGTEDPMELVTNEDLFSSLQDLNFQASEMMGQLQETLDLTPEEMQSVVEQVVEQSQDVQPVQEDVSDKVQVVQEKPDAPAVKTEDTGRTAERTETVEEAVPQSESVNTDSVKEENSAYSGEGSADSQNTAFDETDFSKDTSTKEVGGKERTSEAHPHRAAQDDVHPASQTVQTLTGQIPQEKLNAVQEEATVSYSERAEETQRIADQIMDHMRVQLKEGITELEMQLHPASLGNVNVSLVSREGNITAQFTAQNEAVKNVIETQIVQLREQFEEQGIKVDAVEVAVADHRFEHRDDGSEQRNPQESRSGSGVRRTRRINLDALSDEEISRLTEDADKIQVDMMNRNGNTVDYTV